jgi:hypothetical protein
MYSQSLSKVDISKKYVKILSTDLVHRGFKYQVGLNIDTKCFDPSSVGGSAGLYFTTMEDIYNYLNHGPFIADVEVPADAVTRRRGNLCKANKIIISNIRRWDTELDLHKALEGLESCIEYIENPSEELQTLVVKLDGEYIKYIENPSEAVQLEAVKPRR